MTTMNLCLETSSYNKKNEKKRNMKKKCKSPQLCFIYINFLTMIQTGFSDVVNERVYIPLPFWFNHEDQGGEMNISPDAFEQGEITFKIPRTPTQMIFYMLNGYDVVCGNDARSVHFVCHDSPEDSFSFKLVDTHFFKKYQNIVTETKKWCFFNEEARTKKTD